MDGTGITLVCFIEGTENLYTERSGEALTPHSQKTDKKGNLSIHKSKSE